MARVTRSDDTGAAGSDGVDRRPLVPPEEGSELALDALRLGPGASLDLTDPLHDTVLLTYEGSGALDTAAIEGRAAGFVAAGAPGTLEPWLREAFETAADDAARLRVVVDQVASLTDTSALAWHQRLVR
jgi:hypothetical protein